MARYTIFFISLGTVSSFFQGKKDSEDVVVAGGLTYEPCGDPANAFSEICHCANTGQATRQI